ncbi:MAG: hypothetical protein ABFD16_11555 [Thermoguttaceae bacterium]|jgi:hypothetical protein
MRLTLRTMLAYLDDLLEGDDAQEIGKKIEESERATSLMHRIRDVVRRLRLGAPPLGDQASGLDANTVAEYLDNTLPADRVPDFEKVCLESDVHLAEVASCHQVLTLVLGEPAEVEPVSRQRMYQLPDLVAAQMKASPETEPVVTPEPALSEGRTRAEVKEPPRRQRPSVPDYLREEAVASRRRWSLLVTIFLVACLGVVGWGMVSRYGAETPLGRWLGYDATDTTVAEAKSDATVEPGEPGEKTSDSSKAGSPTVEKTAAETSKSPEAKVDTTPDAPMPKDSAVASATPSPAENPPAAATTEQTPIPPAGRTAEPPAVATSGGGAAGATKPADTGSSTAGSSHPSAPQPPVAPSDMPPPVLENMGQYVSPREVLLKAEGDVFNWVRLADHAMLQAGDRCLSLPTYRPVVRLGEDLHLQLVDATHLLFLPNEPLEAEKAPGILVDHGRLVLATEGKAKTGLRLQIGDRKGIVRFTDDPATLAIDVGRAAPPAADPETHPALLTAQMYVTRGRVLWQDIASREIVSFDAPAEVALGNVPATSVPLKAIPPWIDVATISLLDQRASGTVEKELEKNRPVLLTLRELAEHRQKEVRWLAQRCLATIGDFQLMVAALDDPEQKSVWADYMEQLCAAVRRSPLAAAQVRGAIERVYSGPTKTAAGASLYELLWKYQPEGLTAADAERLVSYLEHETLAVRVVAHWNLKNITGLSLYYRPEDPAGRRESAVQKWKERLRASPTLGARGDNGSGQAPLASGEKREPQPPKPDR